MEARDVLRLPWKKVTDWSELPASGKDFYGNIFISETDVDIFVQNIYRDIARKMNIPYEELNPILKAENSAFDSLKARVFHKACGFFNRQATRLINLENTLRIPDISGIKDTDTEDGVSKCLKLFDGLSDIEKTLFLQKIGKINIKVERFEETAVK